MATPTQDTQPPYVPPPGELPPVNLWHPKKPQHKLAPWHWVAITLLSPFLILFTAVGAYTCAQWAFRGSSVVTLASATPTHKATSKPRHTATPQPTYNLAGYQAAITGSEAQAFTTALTQFRKDSRRYDFQAVTRDSLALSGAANVWLATLKNTSPPPGYTTSKLDYLLAATLGQRAATTTQSAISAGSLASLQTGMSLAGKAKAALARASAAMPHGS